MLLTYWIYLEEPCLQMFSNQWARVLLTLSTVWTEESLTISPFSFSLSSPANSGKLSILCKLNRNSKEEKVLACLAYHFFGWVSKETSVILLLFMLRAETSSNLQGKWTYIQYENSSNLRITLHTLCCLYQIFQELSTLILSVR